jgi:phospholipid/cholesterol/gamma-HCH transport system substrate-binding protein
MPLLGSFADRDPVKVGVVGMIALAAVGLLLFNAVAIKSWLTEASYTAMFSEAGGLQSGDPVRLNGAEIGKVSSIELDGEHVAVEFTVKQVGRLGTETRASVSAESVLGTKYLGLTPAGPGELEHGAVIPLERTNSPYDITKALSTLTAKSGQLDKDKLNQALNTISDSFKDTPAPLRAALDGVSRVSQTVAQRDVALRELLVHARGVTDVLAKRSGDIVTLTAQGRQLLGELNERRQVIQELVVNVTRTIDQLHGLVTDNEDQLRPALDELNDTLDLLNRNDKNLATVIHGLGVYAGSLGEAISNGPWFAAYIANLSSLPAAIAGISSLPIANRSGNPLRVLNPVTGGAPALPDLSGGAQAPSLPSLPSLPGGGGGR